jgi:hypothetical protein
MSSKSRWESESVLETEPALVLPGLGSNVFVCETVRDDRREEVVLWDAFSTTKLWAVEIETAKFGACAFSPISNKMVIIGKTNVDSDSEARAIKCWDLNSGRSLVLSNRAHKETSCEIGQMGSRLICWHAGVLTLWDLDEGVQIFDISGDAFLYAMFNGTDARIVLCKVQHGTNNSELLICDSADGTRVNSYSTDKEYNEYGDIICSADGNLCAAISSGEINVWEVDTGKRIPVHNKEYPVNAICFDSNTTCLYAIVDHPHRILRCQLTDGTVSSVFSIDWPRMFIFDLFCATDDRIVVSYAEVNDDGIPMDYMCCEFSLADGQQLNQRKFDTWGNQVFVRRPVTILM